MLIIKLYWSHNKIGLINIMDGWWKHWKEMVGRGSGEAHDHHNNIRYVAYKQKKTDHTPGPHSPHDMWWHFSCPRVLAPDYNRPLHEFQGMIDLHYLDQTVTTTLVAELNFVDLSLFFLEFTSLSPSLNDGEVQLLAVIHYATFFFSFFFLVISLNHEVAHFANTF